MAPLSGGELAEAWGGGMKVARVGDGATAKGGVGAVFCKRDGFQTLGEGEQILGSQQALECGLKGGPVTQFQGESEGFEPQGGGELGGGCEFFERSMRLTGLDPAADQGVEGGGVAGVLLQMLPPDHGGAEGREVVGLELKEESAADGVGGNIMQVPTEESDGAGGHTIAAAGVGDALAEGWAVRPADGAGVIGD